MSRRVASLEAHVPSKLVFNAQQLAYFKTPQQFEDTFHPTDIPHNYIWRFNNMLELMHKNMCRGRAPNSLNHWEYKISDIAKLSVFIDDEELCLSVVGIRPCFQGFGFFTVIMYQLVLTALFVKKPLRVSYCFPDTAAILQLKFGPLGVIKLKETDHTNCPDYVFPDLRALRDAVTSPEILGIRPGTYTLKRIPIDNYAEPATIIQLEEAAYPTAAQMNNVKFVESRFRPRPPGDDLVLPPVPIIPFGHDWLLPSDAPEEVAQLSSDTSSESSYEANADEDQDDVYVPSPPRPLVRGDDPVARARRNISDILRAQQQRRQDGENISSDEEKAEREEIARNDRILQGGAAAAMRRFRREQARTGRPKIDDPDFDPFGGDGLDLPRPHNWQTYLHGIRRPAPASSYNLRASTLAARPSASTRNTASTRNSASRAAASPREQTILERINGYHEEARAAASSREHRERLVAEQTALERINGYHEQARRTPPSPSSRFNQVSLAAASPRQPTILERVQRAAASRRSTHAADMAMMDSIHLLHQNAVDNATAAAAAMQVDDDDMPLARA